MLCWRTQGAECSYLCKPAVALEMLGLTLGSSGG